MTAGRKILLYAASALVLLAFAPVLPFHTLAGAGIILVGLALMDLVRSSRRRP